MALLEAVFADRPGMTPQDVERQRRLAEALLEQGSGIEPLQHPLQAVAKMLQSGVGAYKDKKASKAEREGRKSKNDAISRLLTGSQTGGMTPASTGAYAVPTPEPIGRAPLGNVSSPVSQSDAASLRVSQSHAPDSLRDGIASTAAALGVDPVDLATAISYETAGTFDPTKSGPTTQWGQHRGLIQFGEPQAQKYGVNWDDPVGSQLGPDGAVAKYLRDTGVQPGMGLLDIYSAINAGGVGRYNRTDANNGGAPGTVRDKVEQQMAGHREKALALMGTQPTQVASSEPFAAMGGQSPMQQPMQQMAAPMPQQQIMAQQLTGGSQAQPAPGINPAMIQELLGNPWTEELGQQLFGQYLQQQQQMNDPYRQLQMQQGQLGLEIDREKLNQLRNPQQEQTAEMQNLAWRAAQAGLQPGTREYNEFMLTGGRGPQVSVDARNMGSIPQGYSMIYDDNGNPVRMEPIPGGPADQERLAAEDQAAIRQQNVARAGGTVVQDIGRALAVLDQAGPFGAGVGANIGRLYSEGDAATLDGFIKSVAGNVGFDQLQSMREASPTGGALGQVNRTELEFLQGILGRLDVTGRRDVLADNLKRINNIYMDRIHGTPDQIWRAYESGQINPQTGRPLSLQDIEPLMSRYELSFDDQGRPVDRSEGSDIDDLIRKYGG